MRISVDIRDLTSEFNLPKKTSLFITESVVEAVTREIYRNWRIEATNSLKSTRNEYINGLEIVKNSPKSSTIWLRGKLANQVEQGMSAYDMKEVFAKSGKIKMTKTGGWYLTIPFRVGTPGVIGESFSSVMPEEVHQIVKNKGSVGKLSKDPNFIPSARQAIDIPEAKISFPEYKHKSHIYDGLKKMSSGTGTTSYGTMRRVSSKSDANSWIHKGIKAHNLMKKAVRSSNIDAVAENTVSTILDNMGYGK